MMRIWTLTLVLISWMCEKQRAVSHRSAERRIRNNSLDADVRMEGLTAWQSWDCVLETFSHPDAEGNLARPSGKRHALSHPVDDFSCDAIDHVPSNIAEFIPSQTLHSRGQRSSHSYDHQRSQSFFETRVTNSPCRLGLGIRTTPFGQFNFQYVRTTEQLAQTLARGWLFDIHPPPTLISRSFKKLLRVAKAHATKRLLLGWSRNMLRFGEIQCSFWNKKAQDVLQEHK